MAGSYIFGSLCSALLKNVYGTEAEKVAMLLFCRGARTLRQICVRTQLPSSKVATILRGLYNYNLIKVHERPTRITYTLNANQITFIQRYIRSIPILTEKFGSEGEMLLDVLMKNGHETASGLVLQAARRLVKTKEATDQECSHETAVILMYQKLVVLVEQEFMCRAACDKNDFNRYKLPDLNLPELHVKLEREDMNTSDQPDHAILWRVCPKHITLLLRDEMLAKAIAKRVDEYAGNLVRTLLSFVQDGLSEVVHLNNVDGIMQKNYLKSPYLKDYMELLVEDSSNLIKRPAFGSSEEYLVSVKSALEELTWNTIEKIVQEQFGSNGAHVFRVVRMKRYADQDQIQEAALMAAKETKLMTYRLMTHNLLCLREHKVPGSSGGGSYLFFINLPQVARMYLQTCYKTQHAAMSRQNEVTNSYQYLFTKQQQMEAYKAMDVSPEQAAMLEELLTPIEKAELEKVRLWRDRLSHASYDIDESIMLLELFLEAQAKAKAKENPAKSR